MRPRKSRSAALSLALPAVQPAPPLAVAVLADPAGGSDVVGDDAAVLLDALDPAAHVVEDPLLVLLVARVEIGVGHEGRGAEAGRLVALEGHPVEEVEDLLAPGLVLVPARLQLLDLRVEEVGGQRPGARVVQDHVAMPEVADGAAVEPVAHEVDVIGDPSLPVDDLLVLAHRGHGAGAAVEGRAEDPVLGVEVGGRGVLADVHGGELAGPLAVGGVRGVGDAEVVEHLVALAHVEPVGVEGHVEVPVLVAQLGHVHGVHRLVVGELALLAVEPGDGVPLALGDVQEALVAPQGVEHGAHGAALVGVVHIEEVVDPAIGAGVALGGGVSGRLQDAEEAALQQGPLGRGDDVGGGDGRHGCHGALAPRFDG